MNEKDRKKVQNIENLIHEYEIQIKTLVYIQPAGEAGETIARIKRKIKNDIAKLRDDKRYIVDAENDEELIVKISDKQLEIEQIKTKIKLYRLRLLQEGVETGRGQHTNGFIKINLRTLLDKQREMHVLKTKYYEMSDEADREHERQVASMEIIKEVAEQQEKLDEQEGGDQ